MMLSCLFSCFYHIKQFKACFHLTFLNFFLLQWYGHVFSQMKLKSAIFMMKETSNKWCARILNYQSFLISLISLLNTYPAITDLLKVNSKQSRVSCAICTKLRIKTLCLKILFRAYNFTIKTITKSLIIFKKPRRWLMISLIT